jgi:hypothetical protein
MPTRADIEAASPRCTRRIIPRPGGWHATCFKPMYYIAGRNTWRCECGAEESGLLVAARRTAILVEAA